MSAAADVMESKDLTDREDTDLIKRHQLIDGKQEIKKNNVSSSEVNYFPGPPAGALVHGPEPPPRRGAAERLAAAAQAAIAAALPLASSIAFGVVVERVLAAPSAAKRAVDA